MSSKQLRVVVKGPKRKRAKNGSGPNKKLLSDRPDRHSLNTFRMYAAPSVGLPSQRRVTLRYAEIIRVTSTAGAVGKYLFSANGLYDPNITGAGHQPYGFDQWMTLYKTATVMKSRIDVEVGSVSAAVAMIAGVVVAESDPTVITGSATPVGLIESDRGTSALVVSTTPARHLQSTFDLNVFWPDHDPNDVYNTGSSNPTRTYQYCIFQVPSDFTSTVILDYVVSITYDVVLEQPLTIATS